jgi:AmmeMemoRadiSam system protein B
MSKRKASVAGSFYPDSCSKIKEYITHFNAEINKDALERFTTKVRAVIVPHAGYVYSGFTANVAYKIAASRDDIKRVIIIGPSHRVGFRGVSVAEYDTYESPCGHLAIDKKFSKKLMQSYNQLHFTDKAHHEHSTEVQVPFIQHYFSATPVVEMVYGDIDAYHLAVIVEDLLKDSSNFIVISTDLSHFYTKQEAKKLDSICIKAIDTLNISELDSGCEACGITGVKAMLLAAKSRGLKTQILDYRTSADASGDDSRVVGYLSVLII